MKRSRWITGIVTMQAVWTLVLISFPIYLLALTRSKEILNLNEARETVYGLKIAAALFAIPPFFTIISTFGLWREKLWGWWLAVVGNALTLAALVYSMIDDASIDWDMLILTIISAILTILLLLPVVRKIYWRVSEVRVDPRPSAVNL